MTLSWWFFFPHKMRPRQRRFLLLKFCAPRNLAPVALPTLRLWLQLRCYSLSLVHNLKVWPTESFNRIDQSYINTHCGIAGRRGNSGCGTAELLANVRSLSVKCETANGVGRIYVLAFSRLFDSEKRTGTQIKINNPFIQLEILLLK